VRFQPVVDLTMSDLFSDAASELLSNLHHSTLVITTTSLVRSRVRQSIVGKIREAGGTRLKVLRQLLPQSHLSFSLLIVLDRRTLRANLFSTFLPAAS
jgi:hypothetical protein